MAILNDVLDLSKIEAGKLDDHARRRQPAQHGAAGPRAVPAGGRTRRTSSWSLDQQCCPQRLQLRHDPVRVRQCVSNLVSNAVKFTHAGRIEIMLSLTDAA